MYLICRRHFAAWTTLMVNRPQTKLFRVLLSTWIVLAMIPTRLVFLQLIVCVCYVIECPVDWCFFIIETRITMLTTMSFVGPTTHRFLHHLFSPLSRRLIVVFGELIYSKEGKDRGRFARDHGFPTAEIMCKLWHISLLTLLLIMTINKHINRIINNRINIWQFNSTHITIMMLSIIVKFFIPFASTPEAIAAESRRPRTIQRFCSLPLVIGWWPEAGGALQWSQGRRYSLSLHHRHGLFEFNGNFHCCARNLSLPTTWEKIAFVGS